MYPRNAASPERIFIGAVVQISDGAVQSSGVSVTVTPQGGSETAGGGTVAYSARGGVWYTPTQAETNYASFMVEAGKTGCIPVGATVVTTASATPGYAGVDWSKVTAPTTTLNLSGTTIKTATDVETDTADIQSRLPAALVSGRIDASVGAMAANTMTAAAAASDLTTELQTGLATAANLAIVAGYLDTEIAAIKAVTDALPNAGALTTIQADLDDIQTRLPAALVSGRIDASVGAMAANVMTAAAAASDLTTELQSGLATAANLATVAGYLDTEIAAILADTNELQTDWADGGRLDLILDARASQASVDTVDGIVDAILVDTAEIGAAGAGLTAIIGADGDTLKSLSDQIDGLSTASAPQLLVNTTIATLSSQTSFTLTAGSADDSAYAGAIAVITDQSTATQKAVASVSAYVGSTKTITLSADPGIFTMAVGDTIDLLAAIGSAPTAAAIRAEIDSNSTQLAAIVADTAEIGAAGAGLTALASASLLSTVAGYLDTEIAAIKAKTDNLPAAPAATGDCITAAGVRTAVGLASANLDTQLADLPTNAELATALGTADDAVLAVLGAPAGPSLAADVAAIKAQTAAIETDTAEIGAAGAGLTALASASNLAVVAGYLDTEIAAIKAKTDNLPAAPAAVGDIPSAATVAAAVGAVVVEGSTTIVQSLRLSNAALGGKASGLDTTNPKYRDLADTKDRIDATVDVDGNRSAVTRDLT